MKEITFELTDYCPHGCNYCSSNTVDDIANATFLNLSTIAEHLNGKEYDRIILSGGEPLSHPGFYEILNMCRARSKDVVVYTNELTHIIYNSNVIDGIYVETNLTVLDNVERIHVLKRIRQGRERTRPEVKFSGNFDGKCDGCDSPVILPSGRIAPSPCRKDVER